jgi:hypothetical protein
MFKRIGYAALIAVSAVVFVIGSSATSEAAKKKKAAAAPPPPPAWCMFYQQPVCAAKGKQKITYANACFAAKDGAKVVSQKACAVKKAKKAKKTKKAMKKPAKKKG